MKTYRTAYRFIETQSYELAFLLATSATLASYVLSEVIEFVPCTFCWYQRILMFPLPLILGAAVLRRDKLAYFYVLPLSVIGMAVSGYHSLLQWGVISEGEVSSCSLIGPSCGEPEILWLGFLTIPFGAFLTFTGISSLMYLSARRQEKSAIVESAKRPMLAMLLGLSLGTILAIAIVRIVN